MSKVSKLIVFLSTPQGKRDITLIIAAATGVIDLLKQTGVI